MKKEPGPGPTGAPAAPTKPDLRQDRLKQALRDNLKRRKSQARGRTEQDAPAAAVRVPDLD